MRTFSLIAFLLLSGCLGMPGDVTETVSKFDGAKEISVTPGWLWDSPIKLGVYKNTKMDKQKAILVVVVKGAHNIDNNESLHFNVDGEFLNFSSADQLTDHNYTEGYSGGGHYVSGSSWSSKRYRVTLDFIKKIISAEKVMVKVDLFKSFVEGEFSTTGPTTAKPGFIEFYEKVSKW